jgi:hypothetical protein
MPRSSENTSAQTAEKNLPPKPLPAALRSTKLEPVPLTSPEAVRSMPHARVASVGVEHGRAKDAVRIETQLPGTVVRLDHRDRAPEAVSCRA